MATESPHTDLIKENVPPTFTCAKSYSPERIDYGRPPSEQPDGALKSGCQGPESKQTKHVSTWQDIPKIEASPSFPGSQVDTPFYGGPPNGAEKKRPASGLPTRRSISVPALDIESPQPTLKRSDSEISPLANNLDNLTIQKRQSPPPMGKTKAVNTINARFSRFSSANPHMSSPLLTRNTSWAAGATTPVAKIDEAITKVMWFINDVLTTHQMGVDHEFRDEKWKEFLDANKEILRTWRSHQNELAQGKTGEVLRTTVEAMAVIISKWSYESHDDWVVNDAGILMDRSVYFGMEWEGLTKKDLGATTFWKNHSVKTPRECNEEMEYIAPNRKAEKNNREGVEHNNDNWSDSTIGSPEKLSIITPTIEKSHHRTSSAPFKFLNRSTTLPRVEEKPATSKSTHTTLIETAKINKRFDEIEDILSVVINTISKPTQSEINEDLKLHKRLNELERIVKQVAHSVAHPDIPEDTKLHERLDNIEHVLKELSDGKPTPIVATEDPKTRERLENIERILKQLPVQQVTDAANMQLLMLPEIHEAIFGEWEKKSPDQKVEERAMAKRTGLMMMAKYLQEWKDKYSQEYGQKIEGLDRDIRGKKSTSLLNTIPRIEQSLTSLTTLTTTLTNDLSTTLQSKETSHPIPHSPDTIQHQHQPTSTNNTLPTHPALDKLTHLLTLTTTATTNETLRLENLTLKGEISSLKKGLNAAIFTLAEREGREADKSWIEEAWEEIYEEFWPQGGLEVGEEGMRKIVFVSEGGLGKGERDGEGKEGEKVPVGNQVGRGGGGGTGTGSCVVM